MFKIILLHLLKLNWQKTQQKKTQNLQRNLQRKQIKEINNNEKSIKKEAYELHPILNPKLWFNDKLKPEVAEKLNDISKEFLDFIELPINLVDIDIVGSNASYNYNSQSDIDLHLL